MTLPLAVYDESSIQVVRNEVEKIQKAFESYIGYRGEMAFIHIAKEILQNAIDEAGVKGSSCDRITLNYETKSFIVEIEDNGRGIPHGSIVDILTVIQSSGKFDKETNTAYKRTAGLNGVGATATNALSTFLEVWSVREGKEKYCRFEYGKLVKEKVKSVKKHNGTRVRFAPNMGLIDEFEFDPQKFIDLCETMSYLVPGTTFLCNITGDGEEFNYKFQAKNGIKDLLNKIAGDKTLIDPIYISYDDDKVFVEVAMTYNPDIKGEKIVSFSNYCTTVDHGTHVIGFKQGLTTAMGKFVTENILNKRDKDLEITGDDCREGLVAVINGFVLKASFVGQVKEKVNNPEYIPFARRTTMLGLNEWFKRHDKEAKKVGDYVKLVAKARVNAQTAKDSVIRARKNLTSNDLLSIETDRYVPAISQKNPYGKRPELLIIEGDSAGGTAKKARFKYQALYYLKGVPTMTYGYTPAKMLKSPEVRILVEEIMGGMGPNYKPEQCPFERIIFATDADVDGHRIGSSLSVTFMQAYPQLVEAGMIYKVKPPLYRIVNGKKTTYILDNKEYTKYMNKHISNKTEIFDMDGKKIKPSQLENILYKNLYYLRTLEKLSKRYVIHPELLEILSLCSRNEKLFKKFMKSQKFLKVTETKKGKLIKGVFKKEYHIFTIDDKFINKLEDLNELIHKVNKSTIYYKVDGEVMTLGTMLKYFSKFEPTDKTRFKGLGEMEKDEFRETTLDPENRTLIRLFSDNVKKDLGNYAVLHSDKAIAERKEMMAKFKINIDDIDN